MSSGQDVATRHFHQRIILSFASFGRYVYYVCTSVLLMEVSKCQHFSSERGPALYWMLSLVWKKHWMVKIPLPSRFNTIWKTLFVLMLVFFFFPIPFLFQTLRTTSLKLGFENLNIDGGQWKYEKDWTFFRLTKHVKPICKLIFPKCLHVLGRHGSTWEKRKCKFHVWTYFTIYLFLCLIFIRVCTKKILLLKLDKLYIYYSRKKQSTFLIKISQLLPLSIY